MGADGWLLRVRVFRRARQWQLGVHVCLHGCRHHVQRGLLYGSAFVRWRLRAISASKAHLRDWERIALQDVRLAAVAHDEGPLRDLQQWLLPGRLPVHANSKPDAEPDAEPNASDAKPDAEPYDGSHAKPDA